MKLRLTFAFILLSACSFAQTIADSRSAEEADIKSLINKFLVAIGSYDVESMRPMLADKCNVHGAILKDGKWTTYSMTIDEFLGFVKSEKNPAKYTEVINDWVVTIEHGQMAFVRGDATLKFDDKRKSSNIDYFTLIKEDGKWKIFNGTYVGIRQ